jgi:SAM-dependent methyltransferase
MMRGIRFLKGRVHAWQQGRAKQKLLASRGSPMEDFTRDDWGGSLSDPTGFYTRCFHYFHTRLPEEMREHRKYFCTEGRGFGEDAFHVMWYLLFREFQPKNFLEIGVFRGQTTSLAALLARANGFPCEVCAISPFSSVGDSVSKYRKDVDYYDDTLKNFAHFGLPKPELLRAYSTDSAAVELIQSRTWDFIYIDGNHDYEVALKDWEHCAANVRPGGLIVLDDAGLTTSYQPPRFATGGHPGPSRLAKEIDRSRFAEILQVGHNRVFQKLPQ